MARLPGSGMPFGVRCGGSASASTEGWSGAAGSRCRGCRRRAVREYEAPMPPAQ